MLSPLLVASAEKLTTGMSRKCLVGLHSRFAHCSTFPQVTGCYRPDVEIGLIPCAKGGTPIASWARNLSRSTLYGSMIARAKKAADVSTIKGMLWMQGQNDADDETAASTWDTNCLELFANIRSDLAMPNLPIVVARTDDLSAVGGYPYWDTIRAKQVAVASSTVAVIDSLDLPRKSDLIHLATAGQVTLGQRFARAMNSLLSA